MSVYYLDSSLAIKLYVNEAQSAWVEQIVTAQDRELKPLHTLTFSQIGLVEVAAGLAKKTRMRQLMPELQLRLYARFLQDCREQFALLEVTEALIHLAASLTQRHPLRGYDALHLATAFTLHQRLAAAKLPALIFASADGVLCEAARAERLETVNPSAA